jgi:uncharacterized membrane protein
VVSVNDSNLGGRVMQATSATRIMWAMIGGVVAGAIAAPFALTSAATMIGWDFAAIVYLAWTWIGVSYMDPKLTAQLAKREDPSRAVAELLILGAGTAQLVAVGFALFKASHAAGGMKAFLICLGVLSVVLSWVMVHTVYMLRYARTYVSAEPPGGIEFDDHEAPTYVDFAYFAFTIGMTYQVSDTNITAKAIRKLTLQHALLSYLFGAVLLGLVINVVATLLQ